ncbi:hypothetical protein V8G54_024607 [Vigna mungo]|uniref:Transposase n=1 Tax=Vigna mungo TaxID=3915 RepID=A0AAQ3N7I1_VIGMU
MKLVKMFVKFELPFRFVENEAFHDFVWSLQPRFEVPFRTTLRREMWELYEEEKTTLKMFFSKQWELIAKHVEACLNNWELKRVLSITVDNATTNDVGGEYVHMRCCAHILSLIVKDGLKEIKDSISKIRSVVKYVKSSPTRFVRFKACVEQEGISYKGIVCLDVETRWNSIDLTLEASLKYKDVFVLLDMQDKKFGVEMAKKDWEYAKSILPFLKMFYDSTLRISGSSYVTSHMYMKEVFGIGKQIGQYSESGDVSIKLMSMRKKGKYGKYWGNPNGINILLLIVVVLDLRSKLDFVNYFIDYLFESSMASELKSKLLSSLKSLYEQYQGIEEGSQSSKQESQLDDDDDDPYGMSFYLELQDLDKYLREDPEPYIKSVEFDILHWWKVNSTIFPIHANMARDVLGIPISTYKGRVVSPYRSYLTPKIVEVLVCTQDWLKGTPFSILFDEDPKELDKFEQELFHKPLPTKLVGHDRKQVLKANSSHYKEEENNLFRILQELNDEDEEGRTWNRKRAIKDEKEVSRPPPNANPMLGIQDADR